MFDIDPATGLVCFEEDDFSLNGENPFFFKRRYNNFSRYQGPFGTGWMYLYDVHLIFRHGELYFIDGEAREVKLTGLVQRPRAELVVEDLIAENIDSAFLLHQGEGKTLTFSKSPLRDGKLPLVRIDETDENSLFLSYQDGRLDEIRTTSFHRLGVEYRGSRIERLVLRTHGNSNIALATYEYNPSGQLIAVYDAQNGKRTYEYAGDLLTRHTNPTGGSYYLQYDRHRRATAVWQDGLSRLRRVLYDDKKRTRLVTDSLGYSTLLRYNENGLLVEATLFDGSRVERVYANGSEPLAVIGTGPEPVFQYDPVTNVVEEIDPDGSVSQFQYDDRNRVIEEIDPDGGITRYEYDEHNRITRQVDPLGGINVLTFNANGNLVRHVQPLGNAVRANRFDTGRMELEDDLGPLYVSEHDAFGNTIQIMVPSGRATVFERDLFGRLTALKTNGATARKWYDANGDRIAETDLAGNRTEYERDLFGLLLAWTDPMGRRIEYLYDSERRLIGGRSSDGIECHYQYDARGRLVHMKLRDGREETISYDQNGLRSVISDSGGIATTYSYTPSGQLCRIESPTASARYDFDTGGNCTFTECDNHVVAREWAPGERLLCEEQDGFRIDYEHNVAGRVVLRKDSTGRVTRYRYDLRGQLTEINDSLFGVFEVRRDGIQSKVEECLPNGLVRKFDYGPDDEISRVVTYNAAGQTVCERIYRYAPNGELLEAETVGGERLRFQYDAAYQLTNVAGAADDAEAFGYDLDHNLIYDSRRGQYRYEGSYLVRAGDIGYQYDGSGRVAAKLRGEQATQLSYSLGGLLREAVLPNGTRYRYEYDGFGRRVLKTGPGIHIRYYWDQDVLLCEERITSQGKSTISYLFIPDTFFPLGHAVGSTCFFYELDQRSLIREVYDATGTTVARFAYRAYGERRILNLSSPMADPPFRLLGQIWDEETGLHYNRFRYFDADIGRYLTPDLSIHQVEHNSYAYSPNPIRWADPLGLMARFSTSDALSFVEESTDEDGFFECSGCGFRNKNRVFAIAAESGRPVGDGAFQAGHKKAHAKGGSGNIKRNAQVEGGTCNCSKGKRKESGLT
jgi:RHS repeat-associated protein